jgi:hypothetical protein
MTDLVPMESITGKILILRGMKVMLDLACPVELLVEQAHWAFNWGFGGTVRSRDKTSQATSPQEYRSFSGRFHV